MCAQTRPRFILSSEGDLGGMEFEPMLTPREISPLPENVPRGGSNPRRCGQRAQALPTELFRPPNSSLSSAFLTVSLSPKPVHSQMLSSHRFLCLPLLLPPCTVPWRNVLARPEDLVMCCRMPGFKSPPNRHNDLTVNVLRHTIPHKLCRFELKDKYARVSMLRLDTA